MQRSNLHWAVIGLIALIILIGGYKLKTNKPVARQDMPVPKIEFVPPAPEVPKVPATPNISTPVPAFMQYPAVVAQLQKWNKEAPDLTEVGTYGKSRQGKDLTYIRVTNKFDGLPKPVVLIHACIHGNEPHATANVMATIGTMLAGYGKDQEVTTLINTRDIYFVPVMCVDSYPNSRTIDGVDPNRDFPGPSRPSHKSTPCVDQMQTFFTKIKPKAVISTHTFGRILLCPYGDSKTRCPNDADYTRIVGKMATMCQYRIDRACNMYATTIGGSEVDWYYRHGAFSIVMEVGTHQRPPSLPEVQSEFQRTYKGILYFIQDAPTVSIQPVSFVEDNWLVTEKMKVPIKCSVGMSN